MGAPPPRRLLPERRRPAERLAAWLVTGPVGHFVAVVVDVIELWVRWGIAHVRARLIRARRPRDRKGEPPVT